VPASCSPTAWAWARLQAAILQTISYNLNYCHHHAPFYTAALQYQVRLDTDVVSCETFRQQIYN
jgi:hypothetical protein